MQNYSLNASENETNNYNYNPSLSNDFGIRATIKIDYGNFSQSNNNFVFPNAFMIPKITYDSEYWKNIFKNIFKPIIDDLISIKIANTLEIFLIDLNDIFMGCFDKIDYLLENYLEVLVYIISCDPI